jgi:Tfp pilus assembly protein PilF
MVIGTPFQHPPRKADRRRPRSRVLALIIIFTFAAGSAAQQSAPARTNPRPTSSVPSPFVEAEALLRQGSVEEAKQKIEEQLKLNPSSVEGYNLLGIVYITEKDYDNALQTFQHALTLDSNSTRTQNNLGNVYIAQEKFDLAEKEFGNVLRRDPTNREANYNDPRLPSSRKDRRRFEDGSRAFSPEQR